MTWRSVFIVLLLFDLLLAELCEYSFSSSEILEGVFSIDLLNLTSQNEIAEYRCSLLFYNEPEYSLEVLFESLNLDSKSCETDYLALISVPEQQEYFPRLIERVCFKPSNAIVTSLPVLLIVMVTQSKFSTASGRYRFFQKGYSHLDHQSPCGEQTLIGTSGEISVDASDNDVECNWVIQASERRRVLLTLTEMYIGASEYCEADNQLDVFDGYADMVQLPDRRFCGTIDLVSDMDRTFLSSGGNLSVRYVKSHGMKSGFTMDWNEIWDPGDDNCGEEFLCKGSSFCTDKEGMACRSIQPFCVDSKLICDGKYSCGLLNKSDEENCDFLQRMLIIFLSSAGALLVFVAILAFCIRKQILISRRKKQAALERLKRRRRRRKAWAPGNVLQESSPHQSDFDIQIKRKTSLPTSVYHSRRHSATYKGRTSRSMSVWR